MEMMDDPHDEVDPNIIHLKREKKVEPKYLQGAARTQDNLFRDQRDEALRDVVGWKWRTALALPIGVIVGGLFAWLVL